MRMSSGIIPVALTTIAGFALATMVMLTGEPGFAQDAGMRPSALELPPESKTDNQDHSGRGSSAGSCTCPGSNTPLEKDQRERLWPKPSLAELKASLDDSDAIAALEAVQVALTEVGDGATYVWHRRNGRLSGAIQPTTSFKDQSGAVCRHLIIALTSGNYSRKAEGIACRMRSGVWVLEG